MATKISKPASRRQQGNSHWSSSISKSDGDLHTKAKQNIPDWQKRRPLTLTLDKNVFDELPISEESLSDITMCSYQPRTNTPLDFYSVYESESEVKKARRITSGHQRSVTPLRSGSALSRRKDVDLSLGGRQETYYNQMKRVYDVDNIRKKRQNEFSHMYVSFRTSYAQEKLKQQREAERIRIDNENKILKELKRKRTEFQREKEWRVRSQYVTWKLLEHERMDRELYGLPLNVQADFYLKTRKPRKIKPMKDVVRKETPFYQKASERHIKRMFGTTVTYPTIDPKLKPPAFGRKNSSLQKDFDLEKICENYLKDLDWTKKKSLKTQAKENRILLSGENRVLPVGNNLSQGSRLMDRHSRGRQQNIQSVSGQKEKRTKVT
ncbi:uncharacterized protein LOC133192921 [Saccostrea echinata]|uniref:uncharacterized protein LOC133192921 n=1 Tax=Saccostrea echinata TaxID=191078 RepID=UPI002A800DFF|nr:uncharacterized protein LOC133192921 [Saccostrea echinata]